MNRGKRILEMSLRNMQHQKRQDDIAKVKRWLWHNQMSDQDGTDNGEHSFIISCKILHLLKKSSYTFYIALLL